MLPRCLGWLRTNLRCGSNLPLWKRSSKHSMSYSSMLRKKHVRLCTAYPETTIKFDSNILGVRVLGVLLPTMTLLLEPSESSPSSLHSQALAQVLSFASTSPAAFKEATSKLDQIMRERLEGSVRQALGVKSAANAQHAAKPQISLRSF